MSGVYISWWMEQGSWRENLNITDLSAQIPAFKLKFSLELRHKIHLWNLTSWLSTAIRRKAPLHTLPPSTRLWQKISSEPLASWVLLTPLWLTLRTSPDGSEGIVSSVWLVCSLLRASFGWDQRTPVVRTDDRERPGAVETPSILSASLPVS